MSHGPLLTVDDLPPAIRAPCGSIQRLVFPPQGATSTVAIIDGVTQRYVVKRARGPQWTAWLADEYRVLRALEATTLPVPRALALVEQDRGDAPENWMLMSHLPGEPIGAALARMRDSRQRAALLESWGATLRAIHNTPIPSVLRGTVAWLDSRLAQARYNLTHYPVDGAAELLQQLMDAQPAPAPSALIHGDFTLDHTLVADGCITGVIDWAGGGAGDPRYDLALANGADPAAFRSQADLASFWRGYGAGGLSAAEQRYFLDLYAFF
jgi:aminoglycoside phosphotransferase (APT) family kinase protein